MYYCCATAVLTVMKNLPVSLFQTTRYYNPRSSSVQYYGYDVCVTGHF